MFIDEKSDGFVYNPVSILRGASLVNICKRFPSHTAMCLCRDLKFSCDNLARCSEKF